jgi:hypothetical protein
MATLAELIAASLAANPNASYGAYGIQGNIMSGGTPVPGPVAPQPTTQDIANAQGGSMSPAYYTSLLANDPQLQAALAAINAQQQQYQGAMTAAQQQALEQYGQIPAGLADQYAGLINPTVQGIADQATQGGVSTVAQLQRTADQQHQSTLDTLAARGVLRSGALGVHENADSQAASTASYNALQSLLAGLGSDYSTYLGQQQTLGQQSQQATSDALTRIINQINAGTVTSTGSGSGGGGGGSSSTQTNPPVTTTAAPSSSAASGSTGLGTGGALSNPTVNPNNYQPATVPTSLAAAPHSIAAGRALVR